MDHIDSSRTYCDFDSFGSFFIGSTSLITRDVSFYINKLKDSTSLSLMHPDHIDWSIQNQRPELPSFQNDYEILCYLNAIEPMVSSTTKPRFHIIKTYIKYLNHKLKRKMKNKSLDGENHFMVASKLKKSKNKDVSEVENLFEASKDEVLGGLLRYF